MVNNFGTDDLQNCELSLAYNMVIIGDVFSVKLAVRE